MDAPFRLAPLATHPLSGGGQEKHGGEGRLTQNLASPACRGREGPRLYLKSCLPPARGGKGPRSQTLVSPRLSGAGDRVPKPLPPPARGGRGTTKWWKGGLKAVDACEAGIRTLLKERVPSNIKGQVNQTTHLAGRQPAVSCPMQLFQHIKHPLTGRAFHVFTACSEETPMQIESAFLRILLHCCVMGLDMNESSLA